MAGGQKHGSGRVQQPRNQRPDVQTREAGARGAEILLITLGSGDLVSQVEHFAACRDRLVARRGGFGFDLRELGAQCIDLLAERGQFVGLVMRRHGMRVLYDIRNGGRIKGLTVDVKADPHVPTSVLLVALIHDMPPGPVTVARVIGTLSVRSFGLILLILGVCALLPVVSPLAGVLLTLPAYQMLRAHAVPVFPERLSRRTISSERLSAMVARVVPVLRFLERFTRPRWPTPFQATKRVIGGFVLLLGVCLLTPIPLSNVPVALAIVLMAFAYLEEDGVLLATSLVVAVALFAAVAAALWSTYSVAIWMGR